MKKNLLPLTVPTLILTGCLSFIAPAFHAAGNTTTWTGGGGDNNWGTPGNWSGGTTPSGGGNAIINFAGSTRLAPFNNYGTFTQYQSILFSSGAGAFTLNGNNIKFYGKIENNSSALETVNFTSIVAVGGSGATDNQFNPVFGNLTINNAVILDNNSLLNVYGNNSKILTFNGVISNGASSTGSVRVNENSTVVYKGANTYTGNTEINTGTIRVDANPGNAISNYFVGNGGTTATAATLLLGGANGTGG